MAKMSDTRPICVNCETSMQNIKTGVLVKYGNDQVQPADLYRCPSCGMKILAKCGMPFYPSLPSTLEERCEYERRE